MSDLRERIKDMLRDPDLDAFETLAAIEKEVFTGTAVSALPDGIEVVSTTPGPSNTLNIKLKRRSPADTKDMQGASMVALCMYCEATLGKGWPLWGVHLSAALAFHAAHWLVAELRDVPAPTSDDLRLGRPGRTPSEGVFPL